MSKQELKTNRQDVRKKSSVDLGTMVFGKIPPQARDIEEALLGGILISKDGFDRAAEMIRSEHFYVESHQLIFAAMSALRQKSQPIDTNTVAEQLRTTDELEMVGGDYYVTKLTNSVVSDAHNEHYCRIIIEKFMRREMIRICGETIQSAYEDSADAFQVMDDHERDYTAISLNRMANKISGIDVHIINRVKRIEMLRQNPEHMTGVSSGYQMIDKITHGWQNTDLIILAARPSVGKTALALNFARNAAMNPATGRAIPVAFFSLEMSVGQLTDRLLASESDITLERISNGFMEEVHMRTLFSRAVIPLGKQAKLFIDDTPALTIYDLRTRCRMLKRKENIGLIIIDYLQLMSGDTNDSRNREREIAQISRGLKQLAKELNVPIIALSQLSRAPEKRQGDNKTPQLSDLRESGAIEQDADMVMFLYRPEYYDVTANETGDSTRGLTEVSIAKHRNGKLATGTEAIKLKANLAIQKFTEWDEQMTAYNSELGPGRWRPVPTDHDELPFQ